MELDKKKKKKGVFDQERTKFKAPKFHYSIFLSNNGLVDITVEGVVSSISGLVKQGQINLVFNFWDEQLSIYFYYFKLLFPILVDINAIIDTMFHCL